MAASTSFSNEPSMRSFAIVTGTSTPMRRTGVEPGHAANCLSPRRIPGRDQARQLLNWVEAAFVSATVTGMDPERLQAAGRSATDNHCGVEYE
jgi:hypothetical protein